MRFGRLTGLLVALTTLAVLLVHLRAEQTRMTASMLRAQTRLVHLRRDLWTLQIRLARAKAPKRIRDRLGRSNPIDLLPPGTEQVSSMLFPLTPGG